ncbi:translocon component PTEX150, putative [Plasmodium ovale wallikeri]|uniref:Translocon component PTEX150, putative n=1 Tax=Plasmodium ovale wallikeri TaxID=864142 RepID=A0A1A8ZLB6_PLAOA|nr:translocon component PTEX150, putative [Plasmodium ovale wallikeri]
MKLSALIFLISPALIHYCCVSATNGNRSLNAKPTCKKSGKDEKGNDGDHSDKGKASTSGTAHSSATHNNGGAGRNVESKKGGPGETFDNVSGRNEHQNMMNPLNQMFGQGGPGGFNLENIVNSDIFKSIFNSMINGGGAAGGNGGNGASGSGGNPMNPMNPGQIYGKMFNDMMNSMGNPNINQQMADGNPGPSTSSASAGGNHPVNPIDPNNLFGKMFNDMMNSLANPNRNQQATGGNPGTSGSGPSTSGGGPSTSGGGPGTSSGTVGGVPFDQGNLFGKMFNDMMNSMGNPNRNQQMAGENPGPCTSSGNMGGGCMQQKGKNIQVTPEEMMKINDLKDKLENVLKNVGINVEKIKENINNDSFMQNNDLFKDMFGNMHAGGGGGVPMMNFANNNPGGNMFNFEPAHMMNFMNMGGNAGASGGANGGANGGASGSHGIGVNEDNRAYVVNSNNKGFSVEDKLGAVNDKEEEEEEEEESRYQLFGMNNNDLDSVSGGGGSSMLDGNGNNMNRKLSDGDSLTEDFEDQKNSGVTAGSSGETGTGGEELITSSTQRDSGDKGAKEGFKGNNHYLNFTNLNNSVQSNENGENATDGKNSVGSKGGSKKKRRKGGKKKLKRRKKNPGQIPFKMDTLEKTVKEYADHKNKDILQNIISKYITMNNDRDDNNLGDDDYDDDIKNEKGKIEGDEGNENEEEEEELNMNEFSLKDIKKLIDEGILTYEDLTEEELRKLALPDEPFYELSPYASEEKDLSLNETSGVSNEQLNAFLKKNGSYHMSYDSKSIDYLKQKKLEKKEEEQEDDNFYDAYKQIKNSYDGIPSNYYHDAPQLIGNKYVFTSVYDKKQDLINFIKRSSGITSNANNNDDNDDDDDDENNQYSTNSSSSSGIGTYKSKYYDKYYKKLSEYRRKEAFKILKKRKEEEKKLKKKKELQNNNDIDYSELIKKNNFGNNLGDDVKMFSKDQLDNMVKKFTNTGGNVGNNTSANDILNSAGTNNIQNGKNGNGSSSGNGGLSGGGGSGGAPFGNDTDGFVTFDGQDVVGANNGEEDDQNEEELNEEEDLNEDDAEDDD